MEGQPYADAEAHPGLVARLDEHPRFQPVITTRDIFERLIEDEIRDGSLTPARRRRLVRYAAQLRLSAVEAGQLVEACRRRALRSEDPVEYRCALRLVPPPSPAAWSHFAMTLLVSAVLAADLALLAWILLR